MLVLSRLFWVLLVAGALLALDDGRAEARTGLASWYGSGWEGSPTASGDVFDPDAFTAAHKTLPFGTQLTVSYRGRTTQVTVNDRGPYSGGRDLDLSQAAAESLGLTRVGVDWVDYTVTGSSSYGREHARAHAAGHGAGPSAARGAADRVAAPSRDFGDRGAASGHRYAPDRTDAGGGSYYVVRPGDTLSGISAKLGTPVGELASANGIANPNVISVGQKIFY